MNKTTETPASLPRRLAAIVYDACLIAALLMAAALPPVLLNGGPIRDGSALGDMKNVAFLVYLAGWVCLFYGWFWTHGGRTLGMSAWKIRVIGETGGAITWGQAFVRLASACLGLANLSSLLNDQQQGWHEKLSKTKTVHIIANTGPIAPTSK